MKVNQFHEHRNFDVIHGHDHDHSDGDWEDKNHSCANFESHMHHASKEDAIAKIVTKRVYIPKPKIVIEEVTETVNEKSASVNWLSFHGTVFITVSEDGTATIQVERETIQVERE